MKKIGLFASGVTIGLAVVFILFYGFGCISQYFGLELYESESDQQRNFNIYIGISIIFGLLSGYLFSKNS